MTAIIIISIYLLGSVIAYGIGTWMMYLNMLKYVKHLQPWYQKPWHDPITMVLSIFSWLGVIVMVYLAMSIHGKVRFKYSFRELWATWYENQSKV